VEYLIYLLGFVFIAQICWTFVEKTLVRK